ncbi:MAG: aminopeptidase, partial [Rubrobacteraceae bacterium]
MRDERLAELARVLVDYSVEAGEGDQVLLSGESAAEPLIKEIYTRLLQVGATPVPLVALPGMREPFFEQARDLHYEKTPPITRDIF